MTDATAPSHNRRIALVVEDQERLRAAICFELEEAGFSTREADCGPEALKIIAMEKIDIVLSDIRMPKGGGVELLQAIRSRNVHTPPVILMTAFADITIGDAMDKGAERVFVKPFEPHLLVEAVRDTLLGLKAKLARPVSAAQSNFEIEVTIDADPTADASNQLQFGRGGFFLAYNDLLPKPGEQGHFSFTLKHGPTVWLDCLGRVAWTRSEADGSLMRGCGVEIIALLTPTPEEYCGRIGRAMSSRMYIPCGTRQAPPTTSKLHSGR